MDVDAALYELGMLSTVTDSRHQYLRERNRTISENSAISPKPRTCTNGYHIVQIDKHYVAGLSLNQLTTVHKSPSESTLHNDSIIDGLFSQRSLSNSPPFLSQLPEQGSSTGVVVVDSRAKQLKAKQSSPLELQSSANRLARVKLSRAYRHRRPYSLSGRLYHSMHESDFHSEELSDRNQSKSNVSSPVKGGDEATQLLPRSRSLDNLDMAKLKLTDLLDSGEISSSESQSMEDVSRDLEKLNVNN